MAWVALPGGDIPIFFPLRSAAVLIGAPSSTTICASAICVANTIFTGTPSAAMPMELVEGAAKARSMALETIARVGPLTSANFTHSTSSALFLRQFHLLQNCAESQAESAGPITNFNFLREQLAWHESHGREDKSSSCAPSYFPDSHVYLRFSGERVQPLPSGRYSTVPPLALLAIQRCGT